jgi:hypothetical protein
MKVDIKALSEAAMTDTESRLARLNSGETLELAAELNAAFLCGWRFAMKQMKSALESQSSGGTERE